MTPHSRSCCAKELAIQRERTDASTWIDRHAVHGDLERGAEQDVVTQCVVGGRGEEQVVAP